LENTHTHTHKIDNMHEMSKKFQIKYFFNYIFNPTFGFVHISFALAFFREYVLSCQWNMLRI